MKKLSLYIFLFLIWCSAGFTEGPNTFFGIKFGSNATEYTSNECYSCADGKAIKFNRFEVNAPSANKDFNSYKIITSAKSNLILGIIIKGHFQYNDWNSVRGDPTHITTCLSEQDNLLSAIKSKYEKKYSDITILKKDESLSIKSKEDSVSISLTCEPLDPEPEWKFYYKEGIIFSDKYFDIADKEHKEFASGKSNSDGF